MRTVLFLLLFLLPGSMPSDDDDDDEEYLCEVSCQEDENCDTPNRQFAQQESHVLSKTSPAELEKLLSYLNNTDCFFEDRVLRSDIVRLPDNPCRKSDYWVRPFIMKNYLGQRRFILQKQAQFVRAVKCHQSKCFQNVCQIQTERGHKFRPTSCLPNKCPIDLVSWDPIEVTNVVIDRFYFHCSCSCHFV